MISDINFKNLIPKQVDIALSILHRNAFEAYIVGGCVRDILLNTIPKDYDITTNALPLQIIDSFKNYKIIETGIKHGTVTVIIEYISIEITTYRTESCYSDNRHPDSVDFTSNIFNDLKRRDFTMNALAFNYQKGIIDLFGGVSDINKKVIRCIGNSEERFKEDALRILRALRFLSVLNFDIELETSNCIHKHCGLLENISEERIIFEMSGIICGTGVKKVLMDYSDVLGVFIPELLKIKNLNSTANVVEKTSNVLYLRLAVLFHDIAKAMSNSNNITRDILTRLKYDKKTIECTSLLVLYYDSEVDADYINIKRWLRIVPVQLLRDLITLKKANVLAKSQIISSKITEFEKVDEILNKVILEHQCFSLKNLSINGTDLIKIGIPKGEKIGEALSDTLDEVINGKIINQKDQLLIFAATKFLY